MAARIISFGVRREKKKARSGANGIDDRLIAGASADDCIQARFANAFSSAA